MSVRRAMQWCALSGLLLGLAAPALAERRSAPRRPAAKSAARPAAKSVARPAAKSKSARAQHMRFGDDFVEGSRATGGGSLVKGQRPAKQSRLLITRVTFLPELIKSAEGF